MDIFGTNAITSGLSSSAVTTTTQNVFGAFAGDLVGAILLTPTAYLPRILETK